MAVFINAYQIIILYALIMPNFVCELYFGKAGGSDTHALSHP